MTSDFNNKNFREGENYKVKNDLPDLYSILGLTIDICKEDNCNELIQKAYIKKAKVCHPDKHPGRKDVEEVFELITEAYNILKDEKQRETYNHKLSLNKQSSNDFGKLKKQTTDYMKTMGEYKPPSDQQKLTFKEQMKALDAKRGYDTTQIDPISKHDAKKRMNDMTKTRAVQDIELKPEKLFDDGRFDLKKFNEAFDRTHQKNDGTLMTHNGVPSAWNDFGSAANFSAINNVDTTTNNVADKLDDMFAEDETRLDTSKQNYSGIDFGAPTRKITKDEVQGLTGADYVDGHKVLGDNYYKDMKARLRDRQSDANNFEHMKYNDFKRDETAGYGIFDKLGFKFDDRLALDVDDDDIAKKYDKLIAERQKDLLPDGNPQPPAAPKISKKKQNQSWR